jgi:hypothetical protein
MKKLRFLLSLTNDDNDYQIEQTSAAQQAANKLGVDLKIDLPRILRLRAPPPPLALESYC